MRTLLTVLVAALIGAAGFHAYYLNLAAEDRCGWDHPFDDQAEARCIAVGAPVYDKAAQDELDELIDRVAK